jgi:predicted Zn finger-like uncharacterized protein
MQVTCPACSTRYTTDDAKVRGKTVRMRCRACDTVWLVQGPPPNGFRDAQAEPSLREPPSYAPPPLQSYAPASESGASVSYAPRAAPAQIAIPATRPEKRAAVVKRGALREHRDLFASQSLDEGSVKQTLRPPPSASLGLGGVGARSEDSILFTVDSLRAAARLETPGPRPWSPAHAAAHATDDEGVIDLNALAPRAPIFATSPLGSPSEPPSGFAREVPGPAGYPSTSTRPPSRGPWIAAGASAAAVALAVVSAVALFGGAVPQRAARASSRLAPAVTVLANRAHDLEVARLAATERAAAEKVAAAEKQEEAAASRGGKTRSGKAHGGVARAAPGKTTTSSAVVPRPVTKSGDACGCRGDFTCILRCSAKGK